MIKFLCSMFVACVACVAFAEVPVPAIEFARKPPPGLEGLVWNKWDTDHFSVLSIDKDQGLSLCRSVELERRELLDRWGLKDSDSFYCKLVCTPDAEMLRRLFGLKDPRCEVKRSDSGAPESISIWVDTERLSRLPHLLAEAEMGRGGLPGFVKRGVAIVELGPDVVRESLSSDSALGLPEVLDDAKAGSKDFDSAAAFLCLLVRKEYGRGAFGKASSAAAADLAGLMGFKSPEDMSTTFERYKENLKADLKSGRTPNEYLGAGR